MKQSIGRSLPLLVFLACTTIVHAQNSGKIVTGSVADSLSLQALPNATLLLQSKTDPAWKRNALSNAMMVTAAVSPGPFTIRLSLAMGNLKAVTVSAAKTSRSKKSGSSPILRPNTMRKAAR